VKIEKCDPFGLSLAVGLAVTGRMNPLVGAELMPINSLLTLVIVGVGMAAAAKNVPAVSLAGDPPAC
jgi:hypothetical protein